MNVTNPTFEQIEEAILYWEINWEKIMGAGTKTLNSYNLFTSRLYKVTVSKEEILLSIENNLPLALISPSKMVRELALNITSNKFEV